MPVKGTNQGIWNVDTINILQKNYFRLSASQVARMIPGATRNAIVGKAHRLGLAVKAPGRYPKGTTSPRKPQRPAGNKIVVVNAGLNARKVVVVHGSLIDINDLKCEPVGFMDLQDHQCCWPMDGGLFCGLARAPNHVNSRGRRVEPSYCPTHDDHAVNHNIRTRRY